MATGPNNPFPIAQTAPSTPEAPSIPTGLVTNGMPLSGPGMNATEAKVRPAPRIVAQTTGRQRRDGK
jgi:hypothetical protein